MRDVRTARMLLAYRERREPSEETLRRTRTGRMGKERSNEIMGIEWATTNGDRRHAVRCSRDENGNWVCAPGCAVQKQLL